VRLGWLEVRDFRNHRETDLEVPDGLVVAVGANAQGKTNLLEAAHYLLTLGSPRTAADLPLVRSGAERAFLRGEVHTMTGRVLVEVELRPSGANRVRMNGSAVRRLRDLRHRVRSVFSIPEDLAIVQGQPEDRRRFLDQAGLALWPAGEEAVRSYERALRQRNRLLKEHDAPGAPPDLDAWDGELATHGAAVTSTRGEAISRVAPRAAAVFESISGDRLVVRYVPSVEGDDLVEAFVRRLAERRADELVRRTTLVGPHRDELELAVGELAVRKFASHGESWAAALSLRLGTAEALSEEVGEPAVVLLDDPFSGLDPSRRERLQEGLRSRGQVLMSIPDEAQVPPGATVWEVSDGGVRLR
jgi:DNA replication and repair protein RecF